MNSMAKYDYNDSVYLMNIGKDNPRFGVLASVVGIIEDRLRWPLSNFPPGVIYTIEFEGGDAMDVHEGSLSSEPPSDE